MIFSNYPEQTNSLGEHNYFVFAAANLIFDGYNSIIMDAKKD